MKSIISHKDFLSGLPEKGLSYLFLYKPQNETCLCAFSNIDEVITDSLPVFSADVSQVRDIHNVYGIDSVPSLLIFEDGSFRNVIKGCHESSYYDTLFNNDFFSAKQGNDNNKISKKVTVYSTPTCSWCNTLKAWLQKNNIRYTDIDVSRDEKAAEDLVRRSGQQGVPQTDINGRIVVGFNQPMLKELLGI
jgi:glutaredoxin-like YruB-family protein